jgi:hypothetical protein
MGAVHPLCTARPFLNHHPSLPGLSVSFQILEALKKRQRSSYSSLAGFFYKVMTYENRDFV